MCRVSVDMSALGASLEIPGSLCVPSDAGPKCGWTWLYPSGFPGTENSFDSYEFNPDPSGLCIGLY